MARQKTPPATKPELLGTKKRLAEIFEERWGVPISPRTLERWPLKWKIVNGFAVSSIADFLAEADRRVETAPVIIRNRKPDSRTAMKAAA